MRVQVALGRDVTPEDSVAYLESDAYSESLVEAEAHRESVDVLKGYLPTLTAALPVAGREYPPPVVSNYEELWERARRNDLPFEIVSESGPAVENPSSNSLSGLSSAPRG